MQKSIFLILHNIRSVHNVGSIFRTADCAGVSKIFLTGYTPSPIDRFGRERNDIAKVALGAEKSVAHESVEDLVKVIKQVKKEKVTVVALEQSKKAIDYKKATKVLKEKSFALIVGNEVEGIDQKTLNLVDLIVEIPQKGTKESLNVSVAAGIALFGLLEI